MRAAIYARLSKDRSGLSVNVGIQEAEAREYAAEHGHEVVAAELGYSAAMLLTGGPLEEEPEGQRRRMVDAARNPPKLQPRGLLPRPCFRKALIVSGRDEYRQRIAELEHGVPS